jgi:hypothetical protein
MRKVAVISELSPILFSFALRFIRISRGVVAFLQQLRLHATIRRSQVYRHSDREGTERPPKGAVLPLVAVFR